MMHAMRTSAANALHLIRQTEAENADNASGSDSEGASDLSEVSTVTPGRKRRVPRTTSGRKTRVLHRWTSEEHRALQHLVRKYGTERNWSTIAQSIPGRTGKQCRERWLNHLRDGIVKGNWTAEEEFTLALCHTLVGSHWSKMAPRLPGRTENSIKNFWNATFRSKAASKKRGVLWTYIAHTRTNGDHQAAFIAALQQLAREGELPSSLLARLPADPVNATPKDWRAVFNAEQATLGREDPDDSGIRTPTPTRPRNASSRVPRSTTSSLAPAFAATAFNSPSLVVPKPSDSLCSLASPGLSRDSCEQSTTADHGAARSPSSSGTGISDESGHNTLLHPLHMHNLHGHGFGFNSCTSPQMANSFGAISPYKPQHAALGSPHQQPQPMAVLPPIGHTFSSHSQAGRLSPIPGIVLNLKQEPFQQHQFYQQHQPGQQQLQQQPFQAQRSPQLPPRHPTAHQGSPFEQMAAVPLTPSPTPHHHAHSHSDPAILGSSHQLPASGRLLSRPSSAKNMSTSGILAPVLDLSHAHTAPAPGPHPHGPHGGHLGFISRQPSAAPGDLEALLPSVAELAAFEGGLAAAHGMHGSTQEAGLQGGLGTADMGAMIDELFGGNPAASVDALLHEEDFFTTVERAMEVHAAEMAAAAAGTGAAGNGCSNDGSVASSSHACGSDAVGGFLAGQSHSPGSMAAGSHFPSCDGSSASGAHFGCQHTFGSSAGTISHMTGSMDGAAAGSHFGSYNGRVAGSQYGSSTSLVGTGSSFAGNNGGIMASGPFTSQLMHSEAPITMMSADTGSFMEMLGGILG